MCNDIFIKHTAPKMPKGTESEESDYQKQSPWFFSHCTVNRKTKQGVHS